MPNSLPWRLRPTLVRSLLLRPPDTKSELFNTGTHSNDHPPMTVLPVPWKLCALSNPAKRNPPARSFSETRFRSFPKLSFYLLRDQEVDVVFRPMSSEVYDDVILFKVLDGPNAGGFNVPVRALLPTLQVRYGNAER